MPVAGLLLITPLGFEKIFKTQGIFKIKERFHVGSKKLKNFKKPIFLALSRGFPFHGSFSKKALQI